MKKLSLIGLLCASALGLMTEQALAHSVQTDYLLSPKDGLALDVTFSTGEPLADAPVKIYSPDNPAEPWFEGKTDENGQFNFLPDQKLEGEWTVEIGENSHADILSVPVEENGIQVDNISQGFADTVVAQSPFTLQTLPAQAASLRTNVARTVEFDALLLGATVLGGAVLSRRIVARKS